MNVRPHPKRDRGSALLLVLVVIVIAVGLSAMTLEQARLGVRHASQVVRKGQARSAAEAGLAYVAQQIAKPTLATPVAATDYTGSTNNWINQTSVKPPTTGEWRPVSSASGGSFNRSTPTLFVPGDGRAPPIPVYVWIRDCGTAGNDYQIAAYAEIRVGATVEEAEQVVMDLRESVGFSTYMFFSFNQDLQFGAATVNGSVHSNKKIRFPNPGQTHINGNATANTGFVNAGNGIVSGIKNGSAPQVPRPSGTGNRLLDRAPTAAAIPNPGGTPVGAAPPISSGSGFFHFQKRPGSVWNGLSGGGDVKTTIVINNTTGKLDISVQGLTSNGTGNGTPTGPTYTYTGVDYPPAGSSVVFSDGPVVIKSSDGKFKGDLTVVSSKSSGSSDPSSNDGHTITVDSNLQYVDNDGDFANVLKDSSNTTVTNPDPNTSWGASGQNLNYASNSGAGPGEYNPSSPNKLGLMANGDIRVGNNPSPSGINGTDKNLFLDMNTYSHNGSPLNATGLSTSAKNNLAVSGSQVGWNTAVRFDATPRGYTLGGLYNFDAASATDPPSGWLSSGQAAFGAVRRVSWAAAPAKYLLNGTNMTTGSGSLYGGYGGAP